MISQSYYVALICEFELHMNQTLLSQSEIVTGTALKLVTSKNSANPTTASPKVMIVNNSNLSTRWGKLMIFLLNLPLMKNGKNAPANTAKTLIQIT